MLMVRAITKGDIGNFWPDAKVIKTLEADYRFRATIPRTPVAETLKRAIENIKYDRVKPAIVDASKDDLYLSVFFAMMDYQEAAIEK